MLRNMGFSWYTHGAHMYDREIKEYDVRAHGHGMVALRKIHER